jgi:hypothetical protein
MKRVLNVGGNSRDIKLPDIYDGWRNVLLDIDPRGEPDVVCDARKLITLPASEYDAVYCAHNLEHYYRHDVAKVLAGFLHVMKEDAFAHIRVPDMGAVMKIVAEKNLDIQDVLYQSRAGPITVSDVIYGYGVEIERSGNDFFAHKCGYTRKSLLAVLSQAGFVHVCIGVRNLEIEALAFKAEPDAETAKWLSLPRG